jgi:hypothetical protein
VTASRAAAFLAGGVVAAAALYGTWRLIHFLYRADPDPQEFRW